MVWDGMRPDMISAELTPNLTRLVSEGARMVDSHAVFPTVTRVNSASLATGMRPAMHGIVGNSLYAPKVDPRASISIGDHRSLYAMIEVGGGRLLPCDTLADQVGRRGGRTVVVSSGSPGSAFLCHPRVRETTDDRMFHPALMWPESLQDRLIAQLGPLPEPAVPDSALSVYFNRIVTELVLPELDPTLLLYWHADPDKTQHHCGFGSPEALEAIRDADRHLGNLLTALESNGGLANTVLAVVSDHGYVTVDPKVTAAEPLRAAGLGPELDSGRFIFARNGCTFFVNVSNNDDDPALVERIALALQAWPQAGTIFSGARGRPPVEGTLPLALIGLDGEFAPDVLCALAWDDTPNRYGHRGRGGSVDPVYQATHGGLSPWEVRNTFVLAGAGVKTGFENPLPAGNLDLAPTLQHLLGLDPPPDQHGRVLHEALSGGPDPSNIPVERQTVHAQRGPYRQSVQLSHAAGATYLDFGASERGEGQ
jgi:Type I phosphodiesterase / nucleotide pyrophosphatase